MLARISRLAPHLIALFAAGVFIDSLRYKFTNAPETQVIFGKLDAWAIPPFSTPQLGKRLQTLSAM